MTRVCCEHGIYMGNDLWDAVCCLCSGNPCGDGPHPKAAAHAVYEEQRRAAVEAQPVTATDPWAF